VGPLVNLLGGQTPVLYHSVNLLLHAAILSRNQPAEALAHFQSAIALTEETADHWNNIGAAYFKLNDIAASMTALNTR
jgi:hypothetical protein